MAAAIPLEDLNEELQRVGSNLGATGKEFAKQEKLIRKLRDQAIVGSNEFKRYNKQLERLRENQKLLNGSTSKLIGKVGANGTGTGLTGTSQASGAATSAVLELVVLFKILITGEYEVWLTTLLS